MKNAGKAVGLCAIYIGLYLLCSFLVSGALAVIAAVRFAVSTSSGAFAFSYPSLAAYMSDFIASTATLAVILTNALTLAALWAVCVIRRRSVREEFCLAAPHDPSVFAYAIPFGIALNVLLVFLLSRLPAQTLAGYEEASSLLGDGRISSIVCSLIAAPLLEEALFRGLVQGALSRVFAPWLRIAVQAALFAVFHGQWLWMLYAALVGVLLGVLRERTGSLWPCIALHAAFNLASFLPISEVSALYPLLYVFLLMVCTALVVLLGHRLFIAPARTSAEADAGTPNL